MTRGDNGEAPGAPPLPSPTRLGATGPETWDSTAGLEDWPRKQQAPWPNTNLAAGGWEGLARKQQTGCLEQFWEVESQARAISVANKQGHETVTAQMHKQPWRRRIYLKKAHPPGQEFPASTHWMWGHNERSCMLTITVRHGESQKCHSEEQGGERGKQGERRADEGESRIGGRRR